MLFYRYEAFPRFDEIQLTLIEFIGIKETPCGWWIGVESTLLCMPGDRKRWVSKTSRKRFAYPTKHEALIGFHARTKRCIEILSSRLKDAEHRLYLAEKEQYAS